MHHCVTALEEAIPPGPGVAIQAASSGHCKLSGCPGQPQPWHRADCSSHTNLLLPLHVLLPAVHHLMQVLSGGTIDEFAILAMLLAGINAIPPLLFFVYLFTNGKVLRAAVWMGQLLNGALFVGELASADWVHPDTTWCLSQLHKPGKGYLTSLPKCILN